jgi:thioredoxin 1
MRTAVTESSSLVYLTPDRAPTRAEVDTMPGFVLLEFGTEWCGFCRAVQQRVSGLLREHAGVRHIKVEDGPGLLLGRSFRVKLWPNFVFLKDGVVVRQLARPDYAQLQEAFEALTR